MILEFKMSYMGIIPRVGSLPLGTGCGHCNARGYFCRSGEDCFGDTDCVPEIDGHHQPPV